MVFNTSYTTKIAQETAQLGQKVANYLLSNRKEERIRVSASTICLYGELGSGKTTFVQGFAKGLGIPSRLLSPTFIIVRRYCLVESSGFLYHIDLYRHENEKNLLGLGLSEILADNNSIVLIEWAEKLGSLLPKERIDVRCKALENGNHKVVVQAITQ